ncbi:hypothetical protein VPH35_138047 [Triticum aestivum]
MDDPFMQDQVGLGNTFPLDHEFPEGYGLEEEDEMDIDGEPLFEDELANQAIANKKRKSKWTKAYTQPEDKLLCECWRYIGQDPKAFQTLESFKAQHEDKSFNLSHCWMISNGGEVQGAIYRLQGVWGEEAIKDHEEGNNPRLRGKTNSKKEDKREAVSIETKNLHATSEGMMSKKDTREKKRRQDKEEQMNAFMEIQSMWLELEAEKQAKMLEMEAENQVKMLEIEAANGKTKAKEVALASMLMGVEIMKVDLSTVSPRKRPWFEKMQGDMLKFNDE